MSGGYACTDKGHRAAGQWVVVQRRCNHSAFNGGHRAQSAYSELRCLSCGRRWRTKAAYVMSLRDATYAEATMAI